MKYINKFRDILSILMFPISFICLTSCYNQTGTVEPKSNISNNSKELSSNTSAPLSFNQISAGYLHACAIASNNAAYCWGYNGYGQLGSGTNIVSSSVPIAVAIGGNSAIPSGNTISQISTSFYNGCAIDNQSIAYCWGHNGYGQLGNGTNVNSSVPVAVTIGGSSAIPSGSTISQISTGVLTNCAIDSESLAFCWGYNGYGQLGNGTNVNSFLPVAVTIGGSSAIPSGSKILQISAGEYSTCAIASNNKAYCWGANWYGELGNGTINSSIYPVAVAIGGSSAIPSGSDILQISTNEYSACAIASDNNVYCWGYNGYGQLGNGTTNSSLYPVAVAKGGNSAIPSGNTITKISNNGMANCAIDNTGKAYCWGNNSYGQLGDGTTNSSLYPVAIGGNSAIPNGSTISQVLGFYSICAIASNNNAYCWGGNNYGELGNGTNASSAFPVQVTPPN